MPTREMIKLFLPVHKKERYTKAAEDAGMSLTKWVFQACDQHIRETSPPIGDVSEKE
jgi:hypothetical protein